MEPIEMLFGLAALAFILFCAWVLIAKMGYPGWLGWLLFVPLLNVVLLLYIIFSEWPIMRELNAYRRRCGELPPEQRAPDTTCRHCSRAMYSSSSQCPHCGQVP